MLKGQAGNVSLTKQWNCPSNRNKRLHADNNSTKQKTYQLNLLNSYPKISV